MPQPRILLSKKSLIKNLENLTTLSGGLKAFPVLKANAYGLGIEEVASVFEAYSEETLPYYCVARTVELQQLRALGVKRKLLLLSEWPVQWEDLPENSEVVITCLEDFRRLVAQNKALSYHLKINSGMNRLGIRVSSLDEKELDELVQLVQIAEKKGQFCKGVCTHLASAEEIPEKFSYKQLKIFQDNYEMLEKRLSKNFKWIHGLNSPGILKKLAKQCPFNAFRPGIHLWGVRDPDSPIDIAPVLQLRAPVRQLYWISRGESVGYGRRYIADKDTRVAILNIGYADGLRRDSWARNLAFYYKGERAPLLGTVSMDMCAVDCTQIKEEILPNAEFEWIGPHQSVETIALAQSTIPYEVFTSLSVRIERQLV
ncbi:MAG: alanine racemase [Bdellovibrionota bacterium]